MDGQSDFRYSTKNSMRARAISPGAFSVGMCVALGLHLVRSDHGAAYAAQIARNMVLPPHRESSRLQYATQPPS
ncbi:hypothetical protein [Amycolatopsis vastitatis]|uniref:Uncharacterized protein n=1 Tax=Amycolatopsis vastitatis TaxID=1905142 RepID=A0A229SY64_9PSEU|nr:hypothetical protein CF165_26985 [Amycolatopsis vastitatis]